MGTFSDPEKAKSLYFGLFCQTSTVSTLTEQIHWLRLTSFGEQFYRDNWQRYREMYPEVDVPAPDDHKESE